MDGWLGKDAEDPEETTEENGHPDEGGIATERLSEQLGNREESDLDGRHEDDEADIGINETDEDAGQLFDGKFHEEEVVDNEEDGNRADGQGHGP